MVSAITGLLLDGVPKTHASEGKLIEFVGIDLPGLIECPLSPDRPSPLDPDDTLSRRACVLTPDLDSSLLAGKCSAGWNGWSTTGAFLQEAIGRTFYTWHVMFVDATPAELHEIVSHSHEE